LAIKPTEQETFYREVDEELRREKATQLVQRYRWPAIALFVLILGSLGGYIWWQNDREAKRHQAGEALLESLAKAEAGNRPAAAASLAQIGSNATGYRAAAGFARATAQAEAGNAGAAAATLRALANDADLAEPWRHAALVRQTQLEYDRLSPQAVIQRLGPLARPGSAWLGSAGEMVALAHMRSGNVREAGRIFARIGRDINAPPSLRARAVQMAGSLGVNALPAEAPRGAEAEEIPTVGAVAPANQEGSE